MITCIEDGCKKQPTTSIGDWPSFCHHTHYSIGKLDSIEDLKTLFGEEPKADTLNWFVASTSGVHGTYTTLDQIEQAWDITDTENENYVGSYITVEVILPRMVRLIYGDIELKSKEQIAYLRKLVKSSIEAITESQKGNL